MDWPQKMSGPVLVYGQNVPIDTILITHQHMLLYYHQPFHCHLSVEHMVLDWKVEYPNANQLFISKSRNI